MSENTITFDDPYAWLKAVRDAELEPGAVVIPRDSVDGTILGFTEADTLAPARRWTCPRPVVKAATLGAQAPLRALRGALATYHGRRCLALDLRDGKIQLPEPLPIVPCEPEIIEKLDDPTSEPESELEAMTDEEIFRYVMEA
jgi:hypothetical protein